MFDAALSEDQLYLRHDQHRKRVRSIFAKQTDRMFENHVYAERLPTNHCRRNWSSKKSDDVLHPISPDHVQPLAQAWFRVSHQYDRRFSAWAATYRDHAHRPHSRLGSNQLEVGSLYRRSTSCCCCPVWKNTQQKLSACCASNQAPCRKAHRCYPSRSQRQLSP